MAILDNRHTTAMPEEQFETTVGNLHVPSEDLRPSFLEVISPTLEMSQLGKSTDLSGYCY